MTENLRALTQEGHPKVEPVFFGHHLVRAVRSIRPTRNGRYYLGIPVAILSTLETSVQSFAQLQEGSFGKAIAFGLAGIVSCLAARKLLNRFHRLENSQ